jgi:hypothetical protein
VEDPARMPGEPVPDLGVLVSGIVVEDHVARQEAQLHRASHVRGGTGPGCSPAQPLTTAKPGDKAMAKDHVAAGGSASNHPPIPAEITVTGSPLDAGEGAIIVHLTIDDAMDLCLRLIAQAAAARRARP